jgi:hypothetical protein
MSPKKTNLSQGWNTSTLIGMFNSTDDIMIQFNDDVKYDKFDNRLIS